MHIFTSRTISFFFGYILVVLMVILLRANQDAMIVHLLVSQANLLGLDISFESIAATLSILSGVAGIYLRFITTTPLNGPTPPPAKDAQALVDFIDEAEEAAKVLKDS